MCKPIMVSTFLYYRLSFLDSENWESRTDGAISFPSQPAGFTQEFQRVKFTCRGALDSAQVPPVTALAATPDGALWAGTSHGGLARLEKGRFSGWSQGLPSQEIQPLLSDRDGNLWIGFRRAWYRPAAAGTGRLIQHTRRISGLQLHECAFRGPGWGPLDRPVRCGAGGVAGCPLRLLRQTGRSGGQRGVGRRGGRGWQRVDGRRQWRPEPADRWQGGDLQRQERVPQADGSRVSTRTGWERLGRIHAGPDPARPDSGLSLTTRTTRTTRSTPCSKTHRATCGWAHTAPGSRVSKPGGLNMSPTRAR